MSPKTRDFDPEPNEFPDPPQTATITRQQAVVVGIGDYAGNFTTLENAPRDAAALAALLRHDFAFELLPGDAALLDQAAGLEKLKTVIAGSLAQADSSSRWLFYFAGHGQVLGEQGYLLPAGAVPDDPGTYLPLAWLLERCLESQAGEILLILDACYSGQVLVRSDHLADNQPAAYEPRVRQVVTSGNPFQPVLDGGGSGHSVFTRLLLDILEGWTSVHEQVQEQVQVRFAPLLDRLRLEIPQRLRKAGVGAATQRPIGGYLAANSDLKEFIFQCRALRLPPEILKDLESDDPARRVDGLKRMEAWMSNRAVDLRLADQAIQLSCRRLPAPGAVSHQQQEGVAAPLRQISGHFESEPAVRAQAAATLGNLLNQGAALLRQAAEENRVPEFLYRTVTAPATIGFVLDQVKSLDAEKISNLLRSATRPDLGEWSRSYLEPVVGLLLEALDDDPEVGRQAAGALGQLAVPFLGPLLLERLPGVSDELFLPLADAIGAIGEPETTAAMLREAVRRGRLVLFLGPDLPQEDTGVKSRADFSAEFARYVGLDTSASLAQLAEIATRGGQQRHSLVRALKEAYDNPLQPLGPFYTTLGRITAPFWVSACYDNLLTKALDANPIVMGEDTKYWHSGRPTVVRLVGDPCNIRGLVVLEKDYELLRENEGDRRLLINFLRQELNGKVVLFLGCDPASPDFALLVKYVLNQHLADVAVRAFLVWPTAASVPAWGERPLCLVRQDTLDLVESLQPSTEAP